MSMKNIEIYLIKFVGNNIYQPLNKLYLKNINKITTTKCVR